tara:strand:- start:4598 stop:6067 length:1470 start_codon:yes stop_codon:yes gene_type:complete
MAYIGRGLVGVLSENRAIDTMSNPNGVVNTMTLSRTPGSVNNVEIYIDGVFQTPGDEYTLVDDVITFTTAPATNAIVIAVVGNDSTITNIEDNTITGAMLPDGSINDSKISSIDSSKISGTLPALDGSALTDLNVNNITGTLPALDGSTLTGVDGFRKNASNPLVTSNGNQGDVWVNTTTGRMFVLTDATNNANVWKNIGDGTGNLGNIPPSGGTITTVGDYKIHTFTSSGNFVITNLSDIINSQVEYLVVAGGGGGGGGKGDVGGGGGGAGGYRTAATHAVTAQSYAITVGAGGNAGGGPDSAIIDAGKGSDSVFDTITSTGGGYGARGQYGTVGMPGGDGGSGGGGSTDHTSGNNAGAGGSGNTPSTSPSQGNNGAAAVGGSPYTSGGGGGASATGSSANGGAGTSSSITGSAVTYAGGGGGSWRGGGGSGGAGGGGDGAHTTPGTSGTANTGGGGGGVGQASNGQPNGNPAGAGGSGIVIIKYKYQ